MIVLFCIALAAIILLPLYEIGKFKTRCDKLDKMHAEFMETIRRRELATSVEEMEFYHNRALEIHNRNNIERQKL